MYQQIDHYYVKRWNLEEFGITEPKLREGNVTHIVWKYNWLDGSKYYYKVVTNTGHSYLIHFNSSKKGQRKSQLFFIMYKRVSKLKGRLLW